MTIYFSKATASAVAVFAATAMSLPRGSSAHGGLVQPASRGWAWYGGFKDVPVNYNWMSNNCGGAPNAKAASGIPDSAWQQKTVTDVWDIFYGHSGCGVCGDAVSQAGPREHEINGKFGPSPTQITASYTAGGNIEVELDITANHVGSFQFRLCDAAVSDCNQFSGYSVPLELSDGTGTRMIIPRSDQGVAQRYKNYYKIDPEFRGCEHCVLQWWWLTENNAWTDGSFSPKFAGWPEEFYNCADITINGIGGDKPLTLQFGGGGSSPSPTPAPTPAPTQAPTQSPAPSPPATATSTPAPTTTDSSSGCDGASFCGQGAGWDPTSLTCVACGEAISAGGHFPLYLNEMCAAKAAPGGRSHPHELDGYVYWMPDQADGVYHGDHPGSNPTTTTRYVSPATTAAPPATTQAPATTTASSSSNTCLKAWTSGCSASSPCCEGWSCEQHSWGTQCSIRDESAQCGMSGATCSSDGDCCDGQGLFCKTYEGGWSGCSAEA